MASGEYQPRPRWLRRRPAAGAPAEQVRALLADLGLHTVCQEAHCPNQAKCFGNRTATFMLLGARCTRSCSFCAVEPGAVEPPRTEEPHLVAEAAFRLGLRYVVLTSVTRDDLSDGGASHFAATIRAVTSRLPGTLVEVLVPDFLGSTAALHSVLQAEPVVLGHNIETIRRLYPAVRPQADYQRSLKVLATARQLAPQIISKSGFMVGLGETPHEVRSLLRQLRNSGCQLLTIGQYLRPSSHHHPVVEYVHPDLFQAYKREAESLDFLGVAAGPYVRSSYRAAELYAWASRTKEKPRNPGAQLRAGPSGPLPQKGD